MNYYFMRLNSPRPRFPGDITPGERQLMMEHAAYGMKQIKNKKGKALVIGPVADPAELDARRAEAHSMPKVLLAEGW